MIIFDKNMRQIKTVPSVSNLIFPPTCGICGRIDKNSLCKKCEIKLNGQSESQIIRDGVELGDKYFNELNDKSYLYKTFAIFLLKNKKIFENMKNYDTIIPVPISNNRQKTRGYNQSLLITKEISKHTNLELVNNCLIKTKNIVEQSKLNKEDRIQNIQGVYELKNKQLIKNKNVLLIDDIYTTGSTVNECSKILRQGNPRKIGILVLAKD